MSTVTPDELLKLWKLEKVTVEMALGHIIQNLVKLHTNDENLETSLYELRGNVDDLIAHTGIEPRSRTRPRSKKRSRSKGKHKPQEA
jgi:hypothetical protein